jgi:hypothetical protein
MSALNQSMSLDECTYYFVGCTEGNVVFATSMLASSVAATKPEEALLKHQR